MMLAGNASISFNSTFLLVNNKKLCDFDPRVVARTKETKEKKRNGGKTWVKKTSCGPGKGAMRLHHHHSHHCLPDQRQRESSVRRQCGR